MKKLLKNSPLLIKIMISIPLLWRSLVTKLLPSSIFFFLSFVEFILFNHRYMPIVKNIILTYFVLTWYAAAKSDLTMPYSMIWIFWISTIYVINRKSLRCKLTEQMIQLNQNHPNKILSKLYLLVIRSWGALYITVYTPEIE